MYEWSAYTRCSEAHTACVLTNNRRICGQRDVFDFFGWTASFLEFSVTFWVAAENGKLSKETLKGFYDGTFFYQLEQRVAEAKQAKKVR
jgi:Caleosin related protein